MTDPVEEAALATHGIDQLTAEFLRRACLSYRRDDWPKKWRRAERIRVAHPELATASIYTAAVCGERELVRTLLDRDPTLVARKGGPQQWEPLLFACYGRLPNDRARSAPTMGKPATATPCSWVGRTSRPS